MTFTTKLIFVLHTVYAKRTQIKTTSELYQAEGFFDPFYWSSTEKDANEAIFVHFNPDGGDSGHEKENLELFVRVIRAH